MTNQIMYNDSKIEAASETAKKYSKLNTLEELRNEFKPEQVAQQMASYGPYGSAAPPLVMSSMESGASATVKESYKIANDEITYEQTERLVQKALNRI
jgi:hypothetical protein